MIKFYAPYACLIFDIEGDTLKSREAITSQHIDLYRTRHMFDQMVGCRALRPATDEEWGEWSAFLGSETADQIRWWDYTKDQRAGVMPTKTWPVPEAVTEGVKA